MLADFLNEYTTIGIENPRKKVAQVRSEWQMYIDGAKSLNGDGVGIILDNYKGVTLSILSD